MLFRSGIRVVVYVDDILLTGNDVDLLGSMEELFEQVFFNERPR